MEGHPTDKGEQAETHPNVFRTSTGVHSFGMSDEFAVQGARDERVAPLDSQFFRSEDAEEVVWVWGRLMSKRLKILSKVFLVVLWKPMDKLWIMNRLAASGAGDDEIIFLCLAFVNLFVGG